MENLIPVSYERLLVSDIAVPLTVAEYTPTTGDYAGKHALKALMVVEDADILWLDTGADPGEVATPGNPLAAVSIYTIQGPEAIAQFKAIRAGVNDAYIHITYYFAPLPVAPQRPYGPLISPLEPYVIA
jgi:hypothetical protein